MKKIMPAVALALTLVIGYAAARLLADEVLSKSVETSEMSKLSGAIVKSPQGEDIGAIAGFVTGPDGRIGFALLDYWISDDTQKRIAVPFGALSCQERNCLLHASKDVLDSAPAYGSEEDLAERKLAGDIYRYFGVQPYWTEEGIEK